MAKNDKTVGNAADLVTVMCKLPKGLRIQVPGTDVTIDLHGSHSAYSLAGHGRTHVQRAHWDAVVAFYTLHPGAKWFHDELVFAMPDSDSAIDKAQEREKIESGFDPIDPSAPGGGVMGSIEAGMSGV